MIGSNKPDPKISKQESMRNWLEKYPQGYIMRGEDGELRILYDKTWHLVRENTVVGFDVGDENDLSLKTLSQINLVVSESWEYQARLWRNFICSTEFVYEA